jgi:hypothetical protein
VSPRYKVVFLGLVVAGPEEESRLLKGIQKKFNLTPEKAESLLQRVPIIVKKGPSKEELQKYVRAFEEIGGKVRLEEEEEILGEPEESREQPAEPPAPGPGKRIRCPQCGFEQPETDDCLKCGIIISKYRRDQDAARLMEGHVREIPSEDRTAWEMGDGFVSAFFTTTREALFSSARFFRKNASGEGFWSPLIYGVIVGVIGWGVSMVWQWHFFSRWFPLPIFSHIPYNLHLIAMTVALPFLVIVSIFIGSAITHICLLIVGGNKTGFQTTFRVICYSYSGHLFAIIPLIGSTIGSFYTLILTIIGVREGHGISTGRAILAVLLPFILAAGLGILAAIFLPLLVSSMRWGGVGV